MATAAYDVSEITLIKRITAKTPKAFEMNFLGSGWCWFEDYQGHAYWLHVPSERLLESSRNHKKAAVPKPARATHSEYPARPNQCNCSGSWHAIGSQGCTMECSHGGSK